MPSPNLESTDTTSGQMFYSDPPNEFEHIPSSSWIASVTIQDGDDLVEDEYRRRDWMDACPPALSAEGRASADSESSGQQKNRTLAPNLTRRSHKKSRAGCFSCKGRKIKCGEEKPACKNCQLKELTCQYPQQSSQCVARGVLARRPPGPQQSTITSTLSNGFTITDMRLFHHFLTAAYPHLPAGNESIWILEVPKFAFSDNHEYLMHAILALGASHLNRMVPEKEYQTQAIVHRGHAIAGLNQAISKDQIGVGDADAMLAATYALTFQASYMDDGLADFITMVRGCALVTGKIIDEQAETVFNLQPDMHFKTLEPAFSQMGMLDQEIIDAGMDALQHVQPILSSETDLDFHTALVGVLEALKSSPRHGFGKFTSVYAVWYQLCADSFKTFLDPNNTTAQLLLGYFIPIQLMMVPITQPLYNWPRRETGTRVEILDGMLNWSKIIFQNVPESLQGYLHWPRSVIATVQREIANPNGQLRILKLPEKCNTG